jgi:hypothetical protein
MTPNRLCSSACGNRGRLTVFYRNGEPRLSKADARALSHLLRSGHIERAHSGDFHYVEYRLKERLGAEEMADD